jgi:hypothetical protein
MANSKGVMEGEIGKHSRGHLYRSAEAWRMTGVAQSKGENGKKKRANVYLWESGVVEI